MTVVAGCNLLTMVEIPALVGVGQVQDQAQSLVNPLLSLLGVKVGVVEAEQGYQTLVVKAEMARTQILYPAHLLIILGKIQFLTPARVELPVVARAEQVVFPTAQPAL